MIAENLYPLLSFVPASVLMAAIKARRWFQDASGLRPPTTEKSLRSPGDSLRRKIEELDDKIIELMLYVLVMPPFLIAVYVCTKGALVTSFWLVGAIVLAVALFWLVCRFFVLMKQREDCRLGFHGERLVGAELNKLMLEGCQVYHDFPLTPNWNLDHIVVAPSGVYAIETKMRSKGRGTDRQKSHEVFYDGEALQYPRYRDTKSLVQARDQSERLAQFLNGELGQAKIKPVLALPGWYVIAKGSGDVMVLNPKMLDEAILRDGPPALSPEQIKKISRRLEEECREEVL
jgi:hypothetical protein